MWPFQMHQKKAVIVLHIDNEGHARGAYFRGNADVLIIDERDPSGRVCQMGSATPDDELRRKIGKHPLGRLMMDRTDAKSPPVLNLHWQDDAAQAV